tara:strand:+ start:194 stop:568 length:375 start_codon:yes stop_codon:yes gene_type:complete
MGYTNEKPDCYGDEDYYDPDDNACKDCSVFQSCGIRSSRSSRRSATPRVTASTSTDRNYRLATTKKKGEIARVMDDPGDDSTFANILLHNTGLEMMQTVVDEIGNSIRHIPRLDYGKYFERKKK